MKKIIGISGFVLALMLGVVMIFSGGCDGDPQGYALAIGLNSVDPSHYGGWSGDLSGCEPDARDMKAIAVQKGLTTKTLITAQATRQAVLAQLDTYAGELKDGDLLVVSYSGHGGQTPDINGDESDNLDETWCLYDGQILDDELHGAWKKFNSGVRILVFSDSCHSGTVLKMIGKDFESPERVMEFDSEWRGRPMFPQLRRKYIRTVVRDNPEFMMRIRSIPIKKRPMVDLKEEEAEEPVEPVDSEFFFCRSLPPGVMVQTYNLNKAFYDRIGTNAPREDPDELKAAVVLISGCEDNQTSADIGFNGLFTWTLKQVWGEGDFTNHSDFHTAIRDRVLQRNSSQAPDIMAIGRDVNTFLAQKPYEIR